MGIEKSRHTFSLDERHMKVLADVQLAAERETRSAALRSLLDGLYALMVTGRMPEWMARLQDFCRMKACEGFTRCMTDSADSPEATEGALQVGYGQVRGHAQREAPHSFSASAAETGRRDDALGVRAKRPPRSIRPTRVVRAAVRVSGLADASLFTPFYGIRRTFAIGA